MPISITQTPNPILEVVLSCESGEPDTLTLEPATVSYDSHMLRFANADDDRRGGTVLINSADLKAFGECCVKVAEAAQKQGIK